jgi:hypothetical protein
MKQLDPLQQLIHFWLLDLWSSKCYLAAFIAITAFLMWSNIILEFNRYILWNINVIQAAVSEEFRIITETGLRKYKSFWGFRGSMFKVLTWAWPDDRNLLVSVSGDSARNRTHDHEADSASLHHCNASAAYIWPKLSLITVYALEWKNYVIFEVGTSCTCFMKIHQKESDIIWANFLWTTCELQSSPMYVVCCFYWLWNMNIERTADTEINTFLNLSIDWFWIA